MWPYTIKESKWILLLCHKPDTIIINFGAAAKTHFLKINNCQILVEMGGRKQIVIYQLSHQE